MQARQWLIDNKIIGENAEPAALGYRIPTQGLSSIAGIRISDVLPPVVGDTIILPDEFTAQTGSDFDIDKLYIARYNYEQVWMEEETEFEEWFKSQVIIMAPDERGVKQMAGRFENRKAAKQAFVNEHKGYRLVGDVDTKKDVIQRKKVRIVPFDHSKGYEGNSKEANENLLLRTYLDVLTDKKNVGETRLPLDKTTGIIKDEILPIVDGPAKNQELIPYKELSPTYQMGKKYEYNLAIKPEFVDANMELECVYEAVVKDNALSVDCSHIGINKNNRVQWYEFFVYEDDITTEYSFRDKEGYLLTTNNESFVFYNEVKYTISEFEQILEGKLLKPYDTLYEKGFFREGEHNIEDALNLIGIERTKCYYIIPHGLELCTQEFYDTTFLRIEVNYKNSLKPITPHLNK